MTAPTLPRLLVLTDRSQLHLSRGLLPTLAECREAGLTHVVLRELDEPPEQRAALAAALTELGLTVIAAHIPLPGAAGLHLPSTAAANAVATTPRRYIPCGRSCHTRADVAAAAADGFDYATLGPFATTMSKPGYGPPVPHVAYADSPLPVYALGGITPANAADAVAAGAHGVAVMGAVMRAAEPASIVADLLDTLHGVAA